MSGRRGDDSVGPAGDEPHDGHLKEALRHAPDATLAAPPALSAAILQQASAATHPPARRGIVSVPPPRWLTLLRNVWDGLTRPPVAASLAGLMVATSLTLLWRDGLMEQPFDGPAAAESRTAANAPIGAALAPAPWSFTCEGGFVASCAVGGSLPRETESRRSIAKPSGAS